MKISKYGPGNTKFSKLICKKPVFHHWNKLDFANKGCGQTALAFLTGKWPNKKDSQPVNDAYVRRFLRLNGISSFEINKANLTNKKDLDFSVKDDHVVLVSLILKKGESSWFIVYNGKMVHNLDIAEFSYMHLLNYPWRSGYVLFNDDWR